MAGRPTSKSKTSRKAPRRLSPTQTLVDIRENLETRLATLRAQLQHLLVKSPVHDLAEFARNLPLPQLFSKRAKTGEKRRRLHDVLASLPTPSQWAKLRGRAVREFKQVLNHVGEKIDRRLKIPSRREIQHLSQQIAVLEKRLDSIQDSSRDRRGSHQDNVEIHHA